MKHLRLALFSLILLSLACGGDEEAEGPLEKETFSASGGAEKELGNKDDSAVGARGLRVQNYSTAVWNVKNQWEDDDTSNAKAAGLSWGENSGMNWDEKYRSWVNSLPKIQANRPTFLLTTPWGREIQAPALECAEVAIFLRVTFASWYHLPFFLEARDNKGRVFAGHFGMRRSNGVYLHLKNAKDFSNMADDIRSGAAQWPTDPVLAARKIAGSFDDAQPALNGKHAGAYFDEIFLNKKVGFFLMTTLAFFGSVNLADSRNTYNLKPEAISPGDVLLERWKKEGIGHTLIVARSKKVEDHLEVELMSGSMPRRQPVWESPGASKRYFGIEETGGGEYKTFGGGLKRWRVAKNLQGRWTNIVMPKDRDSWINSSNFDAIAKRLETFEELLVELTPEKKKEVLLGVIESKREHLREHPASCSARIAREEAFESLYELMDEEFGTNRTETDAKFRILEDEVFAELDYGVSKTCCWNRTTADMYEIIMQLNIKQQEAAQACVEPTVFKNRDDNSDGFELFREFAVSIGQESAWQTWSEDESCTQRDIGDATQIRPTIYCSLAQ